MKSDILKIKHVTWKDVNYSKTLSTIDEAKIAIKPEKIITVGFLSNETPESLYITQTYNTTSETFINTSIIPKIAVLKIANLHASKKQWADEKDVALVKWITEGDYRDRAYNKEDIKKLRPAELTTIGFIEKKGNRIIIYGERTVNRPIQFRTKQTIFTEEIVDVLEIN